MLRAIRNRSHIDPLLEAQRPSEEEFIALIQSAQKIDHQIYSEHKLQPMRFSVNAGNLPGMFKLITTPYYIARNVVHLAQEHLKKISVSLAESQYKLLAQCLSFVNAALTPIFYLSAAGIIVIHACALIITINTLALSLSLLEIGLNIRQAYKDFRFLNTFDTSLLTHFSHVAELSTQQELLTALPSLIKKVTKCHIPTQKKSPIIQELRHLHAQLKTPNNITVEEAQNIINKVRFSFQREFLLEKMTVLQQKFLEIDPEHQEGILNKCKDYYKKYAYPEALRQSFTLVQDVFREQKILLAQRVQPWYALSIIEQHKTVFNHLESEDPVTQKQGVDEAEALFKRAIYNSTIKRNATMTNILLFGLVLTQALLSLSLISHPIFSIVAVVASTVIYYFNAFRINAVLDSRTYDIDWKNCIPLWLRTCGHKIHQLFCKTNTAPPLPMNVSEITSNVNGIAPVALPVS